jgi:hypothetical protein
MLKLKLHCTLPTKDGCWLDKGGNINKAGLKLILSTEYRLKTIDAIKGVLT